jgi:hypothetical protein
VSVVVHALREIRRATPANAAWNFVVVFIGDSFEWLDENDPRRVERVRRASRINQSTHPHRSSVDSQQ